MHREIAGEKRKEVGKVMLATKKEGDPAKCDIVLGGITLPPLPVAGRPPRERGGGQERGRSTPAYITLYLLDISGKARE